MLSASILLDEKTANDTTSRARLGSPASISTRPTLHSADIQDRDGGNSADARFVREYSFLLKLYADGGLRTCSTALFAMSFDRSTWTSSNAPTPLEASPS